MATKTENLVSFKMSFGTSEIGSKFLCLSDPYNELPEFGMMCWPNDYYDEIIIGEDGFATMIQKSTGEEEYYQGTPEDYEELKRILKKKISEF